MKVRIKPFAVDVDRVVWRKHFGDQSVAEIQADVQAAVEAWADNYVAELARLTQEEPPS